MVTDSLVSECDLAVLREFGVGVPVLLADATGVLRQTLAT